MTARAAVLIIALACAIAGSTQSQQTPPLAAQTPSPVPGLATPEAIVQTLSGEARARAERALAGDPAAFSRILATPDAAAFVLSLLVRDPSADPSHVMLRHLRFFEHFRVHPSAAPVLVYIARTSADAFTVAEAGRQYQAIRLYGLRTALEHRIDKGGGQDTAPDWLLRDHDRIVTLSNGLTLPGFWREPPDVFSVRPEAQTVRILAFGDYGYSSARAGKDVGDTHQATVAQAMLAYHRRSPFDLGITVGDNFYPSGLPAPDDERWATLFEDHYRGLGVPIYATLGNHDWLEPDAPAAEIARTSRGGAWHLPAQYYSFTAGPAQFFAIDTNDMSHRQLRWLKTALDSSRARWKIVYGHYPPYMAMAEISTPAIVEQLMPILRGRAHLYVAGHHHSLQHLKADEGVGLVIAGAAGAPLYPLEETHPRALFARSIPGFAVLEVSASSMSLAFVDEKAQEIYRATLE